MQTEPNRWRWALVVPLAALQVVGLAACGGEPPADGVVLAACAIPEGGWAPGEENAFERTLVLDTDLLEAGDGAPPDGCLSDWPRVSSLGFPSPPEAGAWWFRAWDSAGRSWTVGVYVPGFARPVSVGETVNVAYSATEGGFGPSSGSFELRDAAGGLLTWIGQSGSIENLSTPGEVSVSEGSRVYRESDSCGAWAYYDLSVSAGMESGDLPHGGQIDLGGLSLHHGGYQHSIGTSTNCADWFVAHVALGAVPSD